MYLLSLFKYFFILLFSQTILAIDVSAPAKLDDDPAVSSKVWIGYEYKKDQMATKYVIYEGTAYLEMPLKKSEKKIKISDQSKEKAFNAFSAIYFKYYFDEKSKCSSPYILTLLDDELKVCENTSNKDDLTKITELFDGLLKERK